MQLGTLGATMVVTRQFLSSGVFDQDGDDRSREALCGASRVHKEVRGGPDRGQERSLP
jgi:hypothetical protein